MSKEEKQKEMRLIPRGRTESYLSALEGTLRQMPGRNSLQRDEQGGFFIDPDGCVICKTDAPEFLDWAIVRQGYVKGVMK